MTGLADIFLVGSIFVNKILDTGKDGHVRVDKNDLRSYLSEIIRSFIYTVNWGISN